MLKTLKIVWFSKQSFKPGSIKKRLVSNFIGKQPGKSQFYFGPGLKLCYVNQIICRVFFRVFFHDQENPIDYLVSIAKFQTWPKLKLTAFREPFKLFNFSYIFK